MRVIFNSICICFSMFSVFPVPQKEWTGDNMRFMLCALPLVGCVIGALMALCCRICMFLGFGDVLRGALLTAMPVILSGGIHLDGFCDTADALASHASPERKREIMKDSHAGAFAVIAFGIYIMLYFAACCSIDNCAVFLVLPVLSRSVGAFGGTILRGAESKGLLSAFRGGAVGASGLILFVWIILCIAGAGFVDPLFAVASALAFVICFLCTRRLALKQFGGMSGDLAGYLSAVTELTALLLCAVAEKIGGMI